MIFLSDTKRAQLKTQHRRERDGRVRDRIKAVLLCDKGWSIAAIAKALLLSEDALLGFEKEGAIVCQTEKDGFISRLLAYHL